MTGKEETPLEFSRPFSIDDIAPAGSVLELTTTAEERRNLAERLGLLSLDRLTAHLTLTRGASGIPIRVRGSLDASVVQECVVSLDLILSEINELIDVEYGPACDEAEDEIFHLDQPDPPEPLDGKNMELGEIVAQHLSVALDPYPRKEGAMPAEWDGERPDESGPDTHRPFSVLAQHRKKLP